MQDRVVLQPRCGTSVNKDWRTRLPEEKSKVFTAYARELESTYVMFSVLLNEAMELRQSGSVAKSCEVVNRTRDFCARLAEPLMSLLRALGDHAKHYGTVPNAVPLDPANFEGAKGQRSARMNGLLSRVLLSQRAQFLHKLGTLEEIVEDLAKHYRETADELAGGMSTDPGTLWETVDADHYDLNTCLRETIVLLKCFLLALPENQLAGFEKAASEQMRPRSAKGMFSAPGFSTIDV